MGDNEKKHSSKHKRQHESGERDRHKSKKHHKSHHDKDERSKRRERKDKDAPRIVDDDAGDDDMWIEKNIDVDGEYVSEAVTNGTLTKPSSFTATCDQYTFCRLPQAYLACNSCTERPTTTETCSS